MLPVFDGHNDVLLRLLRKREADGGVRSFLDGDDAGQLDLPRARAGGFAGGLFAVFAPSEKTSAAASMAQPQYDIPLPQELALSGAQTFALDMVALLLRIVRASHGAVHLCRAVCEIDAAMRAGALAAVLHVEGAEPIDRDFKMLEVFHAAGLRSLGLVWSRPNLFGHGVPFRFPSSPDTGPGLTDAGKALVEACNALKIVIDLSHLTEKGFWDVATLSQAPLVASHSNVHALSPHSRNLTDRQLAAIRESDGLVGINFATYFLRSDGRLQTDTALSEIVRHADHLIEHVGVDRVGFGSDFDGGAIPRELGSAAGLPKLIDAFRLAGYDEATLRKVCSQNWLRVLRRTWGA